MWSFLRRRTLTQWIIVAMVCGILVGWRAPAVGLSLQPLATIFLRLIKSIIVPLIFGTLVVGIAGHGDDMKRVGRLALKSLIYFEIVTTLALAIGLTVVNLARPGVGVQLPTIGMVTASIPTQPTLTSILEHTVPVSFFDAAAQNEVLQVVVWSVIFALALAQVRGQAKDTILAFCDGVSNVMFKFTGIVMLYAPIGIGAAIAVTVGHGGLASLKTLGFLVLTLYIALVIFGVGVLLPAAWMTGVPVGLFLRSVKEPALIAFSSASSEAAMPLAMERMAEMGVPRRIVAFVIPTGYSFNLDGSTLYLAVASVFVAQTAGITLTLSQQLLMMFTLMLTSKGVAGVPRASIVILLGTVATFHLPVEAVALILGVDVLMDMARTSVNLVGNCLATVVMARWEGEYALPGSSAPPAGP